MILSRGQPERPARLYGAIRLLIIEDLLDLVRRPLGGTDCDRALARDLVRELACSAHQLVGSGDGIDDPDALHVLRVNRTAGEVQLSSLIDIQATLRYSETTRKTDVNLR